MELTYTFSKLELENLNCALAAAVAKEGLALQSLMRENPTQFGIREARREREKHLRDLEQLQDRLQQKQRI